MVKNRKIFTNSSYDYIDTYTEDFWQEYLLTKNEDSRSEIISKNRPFAESIAFKTSKKLDQSICSLPDLNSAAYMGLIDAFDKFEIDLVSDTYEHDKCNKKFRSFANFRIKGSVMDEFRKFCWWPTRTDSTRPLSTMSTEIMSSNKVFNHTGYDVPDKENSFDLSDTLDAKNLYQDLMNDRIQGIDETDKRILIDYYCVEKNLKLIGRSINLTHNQVLLKRNNSVNRIKLSRITHRQRRKDHYEVPVLEEE